MTMRYFGKLNTEQMHVEAYHAFDGLGFAHSFSDI